MRRPCSWPRGFGARFGVWDYRLGLQLVRWSEYTGLATIGLALIALVVPRWRRGRIPILVTVLVIGACVAYFPWQWMQSARSVPPINDISTDTENPPAIVALVPARAGLSVPTVYPGSATAEQQRRGYPDIEPLELPLPPAGAFARALDAAKSMGWEIAAADAATGRIEATAITPWFGFRDDVVIRVAATPAGSRIDIRSCRASARRFRRRTRNESAPISRSLRMRDNPVKAALAAGGRAFGAMVFEFFSPGMPQICRNAGAEFVLYDMEHTGLGFETLKTQFALCRGLPSCRWCACRAANIISSRARSTWARSA